MKLAAIYARVSTARQEEDQTIKTQVSAVNELVQKHQLKVVKEFVDEGWSGDILARPALDRLRQEARGKTWEVLVVYDPDRLARRYSYQELIMDELKEAGIEVIFVTVSAPKNSEEKILYGVRGLFAEYERAKINERFRLGKVRKAREGHLLVSEALYGYHYVRKQGTIHGYYKVNEEEARVVRMMFDWIDKEGLTHRGIIRRLLRLGIKPRKNKNGVWATSTLSTLLKHKAYIGEAHWGKHYGTVPENPRKREKYRKIRKSSRRNKPESEWITIPVPSIVDREVFFRVQERTRANFLLSRRNTKNQYLLAGKIYCVCGRKRSGEGALKGKHLYYRCLDRVLSFPLQPTCTAKSVNARVADHLVWSGIVDFMSSPKLMRSQATRWMENDHKLQETKEADREFLTLEISKLHEQENRYNRAYGEGTFSLEQLKELLVPLREKAAACHKQIHEIPGTGANAGVQEMPNEEEIAVFVEQAARVLGSLDFERRREITRTVIEKVVATRGNLEVYGFIPINNPNVDVFSDHRYDANIPRQNLTENIDVCSDHSCGSNAPRQNLNGTFLNRWGSNQDVWKETGSSRQDVSVDVKHSDGYPEAALSINRSLRLRPTFGAKGRGIPFLLNLRLSLPE